MEEVMMIIYALLAQAGLFYILLIGLLATGAWKPALLQVKVFLGKGKGFLLVEKYKLNRRKYTEVIDFKKKKEVLYGDKAGYLSIWNKRAIIDDTTGMPCATFVEGRITNEELAEKINANDYLKHWFETNPEAKEALEHDLILRKNVMQIDVTEKYAVDESGKIMNQNFKNAFDAGYRLGKAQSKKETDMLLIILILVAVAAAGIGAYMSFNTGGAVAEMGKSIASIQGSMGQVLAALPKPVEIASTVVSK